MERMQISNWKENILKYLYNKYMLYKDQRGIDNLFSCEEAEDRNIHFLGRGWTHRVITQSDLTSLLE